MQPLLRVKNKKGEYVYFETKDIRSCRICVRAFDKTDPFDSADKLENCRAFEVTATQFEELKLNTRVYTDCLQHLQEWKEIER
jgi:hypothetical protein